MTDRSNLCFADVHKKYHLEGGTPGIYMLGAFPPPVHGMALLNAAMCKHVSDRGGAPVVLDLAPGSLSRSWTNRLSRIKKVASAWFRYVRALARGSGNTLYIGLSGGWGQLYETFFVLAARMRGARVFLHHHSFAYIDRKKMIADCLMRVAGPSATHIVGCEGQGSKLRQRYPTASKTRLATNAAIMGCAASKNRRIRTAVKRIGFLSNISHEKGIEEFIAVVERLENQACGLEAYLGGPCENQAVERMVRDSAQRLSSLQYLGPLYGTEKESFWEFIDVLLFPSRYPNETAPLVVYEAMSHGIPVVAWQRGCLSDMVPPKAGLVIARSQDFVAAAVACVMRWRQDPSMFAEVSSCAADEFLKQHRESSGALECLLTELCCSRDEVATLSSTA